MANGNGNGIRPTLDFFKIVIIIIVSILIPLTAWQLNSIIQLREFAAAGDRFTKDEAVEMERRILNALPPKWLLEEIVEIKALLKDQSGETDSLARDFTDLKAEMFYFKKEMDDKFTRHEREQEEHDKIHKIHK